MTATSQVRRLAIILSVAALSAGCASHHTSATRAASAQDLGAEGTGHATAKGANTKGDIGPLACIPATIGFIGVVRPGQAQAAQSALGSALLTQVTDSAAGTVVIARSANGLSSAAQSTYHSQWEPVLSQSQQASLQSCDMLLSDRPAAQPIISAAIAAAAGQGYVSSAATLQSELQEVLISDNPVTADSVIVTLLIPGAVVPNPPGASGPVVHSLAAYTVIVKQSTDQPTGVARGGL
jgi:hypothetical protein